MNKKLGNIYWLMYDDNPRKACFVKEVDMWSGKKSGKFAVIDDDVIITVPLDEAFETIDDLREFVFNQK